MKVVVDTGPLLAFLDRTEPAHSLAVGVLDDLRAFAVVPDAVVVETYHLVRSRISHTAAVGFLEDIRDGAFRRESLDARLFASAVDYDRRYSDLQLGLADASVMALAEERRASVLTFDFKAFRATRPKRGGWWRLVVEERDLTS